MRALLIPAFILAAIFGLNVDLYAQSKTKPHVAKVYTMDDKRYDGTLESVNDKGVYLSSRVGDSSRFISAQQIREIKLRRKGKAGTGTAIGFFSGLAIGAGAVVALHNDDKLENNLRLVSAAVFTFITSAIGGAISSKPDEVIKINGRYEDYMQVIQHLKSLSLHGRN